MHSKLPRRLALVLPLSALLPLKTTLAADWPSWRGPRGDGTWPERNCPTRWTREQSIKWCVALPDCCNGQPAR